jgi:hypothetical protein
VEEPGEELASGQVSGGAEEEDHVCVVHDIERSPE